MSDTTLGEVRKLRDYRNDRQHIFQSEGALTWFVRQHRTRLIDAGALVLLGGTWHADPVAFDATVLKVGQEAAQRHTSASDRRRASVYGTPG